LAMLAELLEGFKMKLLRRFVFLAALSFVGLAMIPRAALAKHERGNEGDRDADGGAAPELDPSLVIGGVGAAGALVALMLARRRGK
jgi:hypothetical protein